MAKNSFVPEVAFKNLKKILKNEKKITGISTFRLNWLTSAFSLMLLKLPCALPCRLVVLKQREEYRIGNPNEVISKCSKSIIHNILSNHSTLASYCGRFSVYLDFNQVVTAIT